jgi:Patatin-like phospholipase
MPLTRPGFPSNHRSAVFLTCLGLILSGGLRSPGSVEGAQAEPSPEVKKPVSDQRAPILAQSGAHAPAVKPVQVLTVTGGSASFFTGLLHGWTQSGTRPTFDVVTGISTGSLVGLCAFLGPNYDGRLKNVVDSSLMSDLQQGHPMVQLLCNRTLVSPRKLKELMDAVIDETVRADLRQAHAEGRRFYIATMELQTKQAVVWDVGAIASSDRPDTVELLRKIFLAATSWAGVHPPVEFDVTINGRRCRELHNDGAYCIQAFVRFGPTAAWPGPSDAPPPGWLAGSNLYILVGGKLYPGCAPVARSFLSRNFAAMSAYSYTLCRADLWHLYSLCAASGMRFHMLNLPSDDPATQDSLYKPTPAERQRLFEVGLQMTATNPQWRSTPQGGEWREEEKPRDGAGVEWVK